MPNKPVQIPIFSNERELAATALKIYASMEKHNNVSPGSHWKAQEMSNLAENYQSEQYSSLLVKHAVNANATKRGLLFSILSTANQYLAGNTHSAEFIKEFTELAGSHSILPTSEVRPLSISASTSEPVASESSSSISVYAMFSRATAAAASSIVSSLGSAAVYLRDQATRTDNRRFTAECRMLLIGALNFVCTQRSETTALVKPLLDKLWAAHAAEPADSFAASAVEDTDLSFFGASEELEERVRATEAVLTRIQAGGGATGVTATAAVPADLDLTESVLIERPKEAVDIAHQLVSGAEEENTLGAQLACAQSYLESMEVAGAQSCLANGAEQREHPPTITAAVTVGDVLAEQPAEQGLIENTRRDIAALQAKLRETKARNAKLEALLFESSKTTAVVAQLERDLDAQKVALAAEKNRAATELARYEQEFQAKLAGQQQQDEVLRAEQEGLAAELEKIRSEMATLQASVQESAFGQAAVAAVSSQEAELLQQMTQLRARNGEIVEMLLAATRKNKQELDVRNACVLIPMSLLKLSDKLGGTRHCLDVAVSMCKEFHYLQECARQLLVVGRRLGFSENEEHHDQDYPFLRGLYSSMVATVIPAILELYQPFCFGDNSAPDEEKFTKALSYLTIFAVTIEQQAKLLLQLVVDKQKSQLQLVSQCKDTLARGESLSAKDTRALDLALLQEILKALSQSVMKHMAMITEGIPDMQKMSWADFCKEFAGFFAVNTAMIQQEALKRPSANVTQVFMSQLNSTPVVMVGDQRMFRGDLPQRAGGGQDQSSQNCSASITQ